jgi:uncharacterized protein
MKCPICRKPSERGNPDYPFCSERCRLIDLGKWSSEEYVISTPVRPEDIAQQQDGSRSHDDNEG